MKGVKYSGLMNAVLGVGACVMSTGALSAPQVPFDSAGASGVEIRGVASNLIITSDANNAEGVSIVRHGNSSSCQASAVAKRQGNAVSIFVSKKGGDRCIPTVAINVKPNMSMVVGIESVDVKAAGKYSSFVVNSGSADVHFEGATGLMELRARDMDAVLKLHQLLPSDRIVANVDSLDIKIGVPHGSSFAYEINSSDASFSRGVPESDSGARLQINSPSLDGLTTFIN